MPKRTTPSPAAKKNPFNTKQADRGHKKVGVTMTEEGIAALERLAVAYYGGNKSAAVEDLVLREVKQLSI